MNHDEAIEQMAAERYLLDELDPGAREEFEEHMFSCPNCALDTRAGTTFIEEATSQLGEIAPDQPEVKVALGSRGVRTHWFWWLRPAFAAPLFAALVIVIGYQNLVTLPALRSAASQPAIVPVAPLPGATRGSARTTVVADLAHGIALPIDLSVDPALGAFVSYSVELYNPEGKLAWSGTAPAPASASSGDIQFSIVVPGRMLENGTYSVTISGIGIQGQRAPIEHYVFDVALSE